MSVSCRVLSLGGAVSVAPIVKPILPLDAPRCQQKSTDAPRQNFAAPRHTHFPGMQSLRATQFLRARHFVLGTQRLRTMQLGACVCVCQCARVAYYATFAYCAIFSVTRTVPRGGRLLTVLPLRSVQRRMSYTARAYLLPRPTLPLCFTAARFTSSRNSRATSRLSKSKSVSCKAPGPIDPLANTATTRRRMSARHMTVTFCHR